LVVKVAAHRGLSWEFPENTLPAFEAAVAAGADLVELDFHSTCDGMLVCAHDETLGRCLGGRRPDLVGRKITELRCEQLGTVDLGVWRHERFAGTRMPMLREVLEQFARRRPVLLIEQKTGTVDQLLEELDRVQMAGRVIVQSFGWQFLKELHGRRPEIVLAALGSGPITPEKVAEMKGMGAAAAHWQDTGVCSEAVGRLHAEGLEVWVWTVDSEMAFRGAAAMGIDAITTDRCDFARKVIGGLVQRQTVGGV
jgi:glycerophosphoryl diester phosphodiesterase